MTSDVLARLAEQHRDHSIYSPSSAAMWMTCPGSLIANAMAHDTAGQDAAEGTAAHDVAERWLRTGVQPTPRGLIRVDGRWVDEDDGMLAYVQQYVDWCNEQPGRHYVEQKLKAGDGLFPIAGQGGTVDFAALTWGHAKLIDLKYGKGIRVYAEANPQVMLYALYLFQAWDWYYGFETISISICQPRLDHFDTWSITRAELLTFAEIVRVKAADAWRLDAPRAPSEKACQWCKAQKNCPAYLSWFAALRDDEAGSVFDVPTMTADAEHAADPFADDPITLPELTVDAWCRILPMRGAVEAWFKAGEAKVFGAASAGLTTPGWKIVQGRANRGWKDEVDAQTRMVEVGIPLDETETRKLLSPNQAEEALHALTRMPKKKAAELFQSFTETKDGGLSLVRVSDKREAVESHGDVFDGDV